MKFKFFLFFLLLFIISCQPPSEKQKIEEGTIEYEITYIEKNTSNYLSALLPGKMTLKFNSDNCMNEIEGFFSLFSITNYIDSKKHKSTTILKFFSKKYIYEGKKNEYSCCFDDFSGIEIEYVNETKQIAGLECKKAIVHFPNSRKESFVIYYTTDIQIDDPNWANPYQMIDGVLMEFQLKLGSINMKLIAKEVIENKIFDTDFDIPLNNEKISRKKMENILDKLVE